MSTASELRELDDNQLLNELTDAKQELFNLRFQHATGQLDNTARLRQLKRDIARLLTVLRAREIEAAEALEAQQSRQQRTEQQEAGR